MRKIFFALSALLAAAVSCTEEPTGQDEVKATYYLVSNQKDVATLTEDRSKDVSLNVKTRESIGGTYILTFDLKADLAQVDAYNAANGTDYLPMPAEAYTFENPSVSVIRFATSSTATKVTLTANGIEAGKTYVLPITIDKVSGGEYKIDETAKTVYLLSTVNADNTDAEVDITAGLYDDLCLPAPDTKTPDLVIKTVEDMRKLPTILEDGKIKYAVLEADIDMSSIQDWQPLNTASPYTKGLELNGNGHTIKNFSCSQGSYRSFFGIMYGKCYNVKFENAVIDGTANDGSQPCGVVAGYAGNKSGHTYGLIYDVHTTGTITAKAGGVGGLVGVAVNLIMKRCSFDGKIENNGRRMGGLVGYHNCQEENTYLRIEDSWSAGSVSGQQNIGGIIGQTQYDNGKNGYDTKASLIRNCYSTMTVTANQNAGGISGGCSYGGTYATAEYSINKDMVIGNIAWNDMVEAKSTSSGNYSSGAVVGFCNIYQYFVDCYRKPNMSFSCPVSGAKPITLLDQDNSSPENTLYIGTLADPSCPYAYQHAYPYHGKEAPADATVSSLARKLKWNEIVWDLSGDLPKLIFPANYQAMDQEKPEDNKDNEGDGDNNNQGPAVDPATGAPMTVRFISYNVGRFNKYESALGHKSYPEVAQVIKEIGGTVVGLNETNKGQATELASALGAGWTGYFAYAANTTYGNSIVAAPKYKVVKEYPRVAIPKVDENTSEVRSLGVVEYEDFVFCVTHLDHLSVEARKYGVKVITDWCLENYGPGKTNKPVILLGDMNCIPAEVTIGNFKENWDWVSANEYTFPCPNATKCIDFIFVLKNGVSYTKGESHSVFKTTTTDIEKASDHYPIYADITFNAQK